ncbi:hypothetical protein JYU34_012667 [Plutella xylostella]|uniref:BAG domain-containing protein n=1 Tax=Plutella xylostella TaxID=51655 RepID=A0ABQ7QBV7_PLUXY|nr:hypothetical protein JYU34_012667 [Plutella xylostella]
MESPVVVDKPPEYGNTSNERGFPFEEEESGGAWSSLAARHPDLAARLRPGTWARKRRPSAHDGDDFGDDDFAGFDRFPFDDIPAEFRSHFPSHLRGRFTQEPAPPPGPAPGPSAQPEPQHQPQPQTEPEPPLSQHGLRNTVDLGQRSEPAAERAPRAMSAPPDAAPAPPAHSAPPHEPSNVRHIPIFVEGRDEPVINKQPAEARRTPPPHVDRDQYFADDGPATFHHPPNFSRAFGTPFNKGFRPGPQPFTQQKAYPQQFARAASPQRDQDGYVKVPVHHEPPPPRPHTPQQKPQPQPQHKPAPAPAAPPAPAPAPAPPAPGPHDPITQILSIQTDVLNLMSEVENFTGSKQDKRYLFLDEMLTRNLIKLDNIETEGKENIRLARKEAIKCIQKCIAVLEAKAEQGSAAARAQQNGTETAETKEEQASDAPPAAPAPSQDPPPAPPAAADPQPTDTSKDKDANAVTKDSSKSDVQQKEETMQVDDKGDSQNTQMEVDGAAASQ